MLSDDLSSGPSEKAESEILMKMPLQHVKTIECDYDKNPTDLYSAIERKEWDHAISIIHSDEAEEQAATWVVRKELNGQLRWRLLPLHAAVMFRCPVKVVELLLADYPAAAQSKDDQGMLPLHLAFRNESSWEIIEELMTAYPQAIFVSDRKSRTPLDCGCRTPSGNGSVGSVSPHHENKSFQAVCSVLDLYAQITSSEERRRVKDESKSVVKATISQLQDSQYDKLKSLKSDFRTKEADYKSKIAKLKEENRCLKEVTQSQELDLSVAQSTEKQLTDKLREMTIALKQSNQAIKAQQEDRTMDETTLFLKNTMEKLLIQQKQYERQFNSLLANYETLLTERRKIQSIFVEASEQQILNEKEVLEDAKSFLREQQRKLSQDILGAYDEKKMEDA